MAERLEQHLRERHRDRRAAVGETEEIPREERPQERKLRQLVDAAADVGGARLEQRRIAGEDMDGRLNPRWAEGPHVECQIF